MCGFAVTYDPFSEASTIPFLEKASSIIEHRGPDSDGLTQIRLMGRAANVEFVGSVGLAFRRLAIVDLSEAADQPFISEDKTKHIVFNGQIYNHREIRAELEALGHRFRTRGDTEVVLQAFTEWGPECTSKFNGMWAFIIVDRNNPKCPLFVSRDRMGVKPLYWAKHNSTYLFCSEIKGLVGSHGVRFEPNSSAVYKFLISGDMPSATTGDTFFSNINCIKPATNYTFGPEGVDFNTYWKIPEKNESNSDRILAAQTLKGLLQKSVSLRTPDEVAYAACLSSGLDSSSIVSLLLTGAEKLPIETFTTVFDEPGIHNEFPMVKDFAADKAINPNPVTVSVKALEEELLSVVWHQDEPFGGLSIYAQWALMKGIRAQNIKVVLDGQGADEVLGGYHPYTVALLDTLKAQGFRALLRSVLSLKSKHLSSAQLVMRGCQVLLLSTKIGSSLARIPGIVHRSGLQRTFQDILNPNLFGAAQAQDTASFRRKKPPTSVHETLQRQVTEGSLPELLRYQDRNSMAHSVEGRTPFLDYRLVEFAFRDASDLRVVVPTTKRILRDAMRSDLPLSITDQKTKVAFETPESAWVSAIESLGPMKALMAEAHYVSDWPTALRVLTPRQRWRLMNVELWHRCFATETWEGQGGWAALGLPEAGVNRLLEPV
jgi:asparagine synthase (glutamine-hydrolysing)